MVVVMVVVVVLAGLCVCSRDALAAAEPSQRAPPGLLHQEVGLAPLGVVRGHVEIAGGVRLHAHPAPVHAGGARGGGCHTAATAPRQTAGDAAVAAHDLDLVDGVERGLLAPERQPTVHDGEVMMISRGQVSRELRGQSLLLLLLCPAVLEREGNVKIGAVGQVNGLPPFLLIAAFGKSF